MKTVVKLAAKYRTGRKETYQVGSGWAKNAMERADHTLKNANDDWRRAEFARSNAIEASLVGPTSGHGASLKARGRAATA